MTGPALVDRSSRPSVTARRRSCGAALAARTATSRRCPRPGAAAARTAPERRATARPGGRAARASGCAAAQVLVDAERLRPRVSVHTLYTSAPPGATSCDRRVDQLALQPARRSTSSGWMRQRASGRRRNTPRPEHGASTSTRSNEPPERSGGRRASATTDASRSDPSAAGTFSATSRARTGRDVGRRPPAHPSRQVRVALPPGAAHRSSDPHRRAAASTSSATHCDASVLHVAVGALGDLRPARSSCSSAAYASPRPRSAMSRSTIQSG